jgi:hypothetical protein
MLNGQHQQLNNAYTNVIDSVNALKQQLSLDSAKGYQLTSISTHRSLLASVSDEQYQHLLSDVANSLSNISLLTAQILIPKLKLIIKDQSQLQQSTKQP